ncbi:LicD family protein [Pediococcus acidilactici]|uniref:LicD family protein n=1 Tax=Pediococcus acidilactici TaxID=1254 RepID=UPI0013C2DFEC|nr:LicD family protein [Pediococcus acidilactici]
MIATSLKQLQEADLRIALKIKDICEKYGLRYFLIGGSLLGAVRHKGFIPWDDDMDIALPRMDYEKLLSFLEKELPDGYFFENFKTNSNYRYYITRVSDSSLSVKEVNDVKGNTKYASIDIFPIDGTPNNLVLRKIFYGRILARRALISMYYSSEINKFKKRNLLEKVLIHTSEKIDFKKIVNPNKLLWSIDKLLKKYPYDSSENVGTIMGAYRTKEIVDKKLFGTAAKLAFDKEKFNCPELYEKYLSHMYGDYMKIPNDAEKRVNRHYIF